MKTKDISKQFTFSKEELQKLKDVQAGITISNAQSDGLKIYKNAILSAVYQRLGIEGEAREGYSNNIQYNLFENKIIYTESPIKKEKNVKE